MLSYTNFPTWISPKVVPFLPVRWYAVMYLVASAVTYVIFRYQCKHEHILGHLTDDDVLSLFIHLIIGLTIGGRVFSTLFYEGSFYYWTHPHLIFWPFRHGKFVGLPGMSYHGGVVGAAAGCYLFCKKHKCKFGEVADVILCGAPLGYTFGRLGNFINGELWGRCTGTSYGMIFPNADRLSTRIKWVRDACDAAGIDYQIGDYVNLPRYPSQLYEAFFEGIVIFALIWFIFRPLMRKEKFPYGHGFLVGFYFIAYGFFRFIIEYFREPDEQLGFVIALGKETEPTALFQSVWNFSLGQVFCFAMILFGAFVVHITRKHESR